jgi:hypothetical protein
MFVRRMQHIHNAAKLALDRYRAATVDRTDGLVTTLHQLLLDSPGGRARSTSVFRSWTR